MLTNKSEVIESPEEFKRRVEAPLPPILGVVVKRTVRIYPQGLLKIRQRVILEEPPEGGGAALYSSG